MAKQCHQGDSTLNVTCIISSVGREDISILCCSVNCLLFPSFLAQELLPVCMVTSDIAMALRGGISHQCRLSPGLYTPATALRLSAGSKCFQAWVDSVESTKSQPVPAAAIKRGQRPLDDVSGKSFIGLGCSRTVEAEWFRDGVRGEAFYRIGALVFKIAKAVVRCAVPQAKEMKGENPLRKLGAWEA